MQAERSQEEQYHIGQNLDVRDSVGKWVNAEVRFVGNGTVYVHYTGWSAKYDESIDINSERILTQWEQGKEVRLNNRVDAYHPIGGWLEARVLEVGQRISDKEWPIKVHFFNYHKKYDMWANLFDNNQVAIIGSRSNAHGIGKKRSKNAKVASINQMIKKLLEQRAQDLNDKLAGRGFIIKKSSGDGNCLFRSISDQLYGTQNYHAEIRKHCMDYISYEKAFFQDYITGEMEDYLEKKRRDGQWGDDIEIQAISQIYARPIEIYVFGDKPIRTFHEQNETNVEPIRLAYIGACHYDSIKLKSNPDGGLLPNQFGDYENMVLSAYQNGSASLNNLRNRDVFSNCNRVEDTVEQQLMAENRQELKIEDELNEALEISQTEAILQQIEKAELSELQKQYQMERVREQIRKIEEKEIEEAKKLSKVQSQAIDRPYWFDSIAALGYSEKEIQFAIEVKGFDPDAVQNFLLDNMI